MFNSTFWAASRCRGFPEPVPVYSVTGAGELTSWQVRKTRSVSRFVNRSDETALLRQLVEETSTGGQTVCLTGDPGIGKSRLVHEFVQELETDGWQLIDAECSANSQGSPFAALKGLLRSIARPGGGARSRPDPRLGLPQILRLAVDAVLDVPLSSRRTVGRAGNPSRAAAPFPMRAARSWRARLASSAPCCSSKTCTGSTGQATPSWPPLHRSRRSSVADHHYQPAQRHSAVGRKMQCRNLFDAASRRACRAGRCSTPSWEPSETTFDLKSRIIRHTANVPLFVEEARRRLKETDILRGQWGELTLSQPVEELGIPTASKG